MLVMLVGLDLRIRDDCLKIEVTANTLCRADFCFVVWLRKSYFAWYGKLKVSWKSIYPIKVIHLFKVVWYLYHFLDDRKDACLSQHPCRFWWKRYWKMFDWTDDLARSPIYLVHTLFESRKMAINFFKIQFAHSQSNTLISNCLVAGKFFCCFYWIRFSSINCRRGDRTHIGHCTTLDREGKNSKNDFKNQIFLKYIFCSVIFDCYKFHQNLMVIAWDIQEIKKNLKNSQVCSPLTVTLCRSVTG